MGQAMISIPAAAQERCGCDATVPFRRCDAPFWIENVLALSATCGHTIGQKIATPTTSFT